MTGQEAGRWDRLYAMQQRAEQAEAELEQAVAERDALKQAMWDAYVMTGADPDGDETWHCTTDAAIHSLMHAVEVLRTDYDESITESEQAVAERDAAIAAVGEPCAECGHIDWRSDPNPLLERLEQAVAERDEAMATLSEDNDRVFALLAERDEYQTRWREQDAQLLAKEIHIGHLVAERDRYRDALEAIAKGNWNVGNLKPGLTVMEYARAALAVSTP